MYFLKQTIKFLIPAFVCFIVYSRANVVPPNGGPKDEVGPSPIWTDPVDQTLNFTGKKITFRFDEFIKPGGYVNEVFISPVQAIPPSVIVKGKKLIIQLQDTLIPNTTYVVTVGTGIKDATEGNDMASPIIFAFSTGNQLDSLSIKGRITEPKTGIGLKDMTVLLYPENQIVGDSIFDVKPIYASITDENGNFGLYYLSRQKYKIYGVLDVDKSYSYNQITEAIALTDDQSVVFPDSEFVVTKDLFLFLPDQKGPVPRGIAFANTSTVSVDFREKIREGFNGDSLQIFISDTLGENRQEITDFTFVRENPNYLIFPFQQVEDQAYNIEFVNLFDTLGNQSDTIARLYSDAIEKEFKSVLLFSPYVQLDPPSVNIQTTWQVSDNQLDTMISIRDTFGNYLTSNWKVNGHTVSLYPDSFPKDKSRPYNLLLMNGLLFKNDSISDSTFTFPLTFPNLTQLGTLKGYVEDSAYPGNWIVELRDEQKKVVRKSEGEKFDFKNVPGGKYTITMINDEDGNQYWSPGSLFPYKLPEKIWYDPKPVEVKANWEVEDYVILPTKAAAPAPVKEMEKKK